MQNHLELHQLQHQERVRQAEQERLAQQLRTTNLPTAPVLYRVGEALVGAGERLKQHAAPRNLHYAQ